MKRFATREEAKQQCCGNESVVDLLAALFND